MKINIRAYGMLQEAINNKNWVTFEVKQGITVAELLEQLNLKNEEVMNVINKGNICTLDYIIQEDDKLELLPLISAG